MISIFPFRVYTLDLLIRSFYVLFSYILCWLLMFNFIETSFLFEVYPLLSTIPKKRFILTQITHLFNTVWLLTFYLSSIFIYPLIINQVKQFCVSSWYSYQLKLYIKTTKLQIYFFYIIYLFIHLGLITNFLTFFLYWEVLDEFSLLRIEAEISLYYYIIWIISLKFSFTFSLLTFSLLTFICFYIFNLTYIFNLIFFNKKIFLLFLLVLLYILFPPDILTQILLTLFSISIIEFIFLLICIKYSIKNDYIKAAIKNPS